ncbi:MAG: Gfo/Idh/MocA family oxidoreductase [Atopobiaceae bacterium]|nr:Gfo/Idh/MocA family oxidoreductase [Atopobiaceae bacterium]
MRIGVLCPSNIALRRFMPALVQVDGLEYAGVAIASASEWQSAAGQTEYADVVAVQESLAQEFVNGYGGEVYDGYTTLIEDADVDAVYVPLPPALHYAWARRALEAGKHVLVEKPFTTEIAQTKALLDLAEARGLAVHENYMFAFHSQIAWVQDCISRGELGDVRLIRVDFGFPFRGQNDFRYSRELGGGALLDAGGYALKLAAMLLGHGARVTTACLSGGRGLDVDLYGSASLANDEGSVAQVAFGMDNDYRCNIDVWGSKATLTSGRILTAPEGFAPTMTIRCNGEAVDHMLEPDDAFRKSIEHFMKCIESPEVAALRRSEILEQARLVEAVRLLDVNGS